MARARSSQSARRRLRQRPRSVPSVPLPSLPTAFAVANVYAWPAVPGPPSSDADGLGRRLNGRWDGRLSTFGLRGRFLNLGRPRFRLGGLGGSPFGPRLTSLGGPVVFPPPTSGTKLFPARRNGGRRGRLVLDLRLDAAGRSEEVSADGLPSASTGRRGRPERFSSDKVILFLLWGRFFGRERAVWSLLPLLRAFYLSICSCTVWGWKRQGGIQGKDPPSCLR